MSTVMFADIAESSRLYREFGDRKASRIVTGLLDRIAARIESGGGRIIDRIGDELMSLFRDRCGAVKTASQLADCCLAFARDQDLTLPLLLRTGLFHGEVLEEEGRIFGDCVYSAKRLTDAAKAGQVLLGPGLEEVARGIGIPCRFLERRVLKGQAAAVTLYEMIDCGADATLRLPREVLQRHEVIVTANGEEHHLAPGKRLTLGRCRPSDVCLVGAMISRLHARIENESGHPLLHDMSTNGCFLRVDGEPPDHLILRESVPLVGHGLIGLGAQPCPDGAHTLAYRCVAAAVPGEPQRRSERT